MTKLVFCKDCGSRNSWERDPDHDWKTESGIVFEFAYRCSVCGSVTLGPKGEQNGN